MITKKLIEVSLPLEAINEQASREKSIRHGHPATLHLWWSRKPTAAARAVLFASLVDDPSSHPELFPTEEEQIKERERLFDIIRDLVKWEKANDENVISLAKEEIRKYTHGMDPVVLDPFAGGGSITFEAQRLGLEAHAHDLNPVSVLINKAMIDIPQRFMDLSPVNPDHENRFTCWENATGLADDINFYGEKLKSLLFDRVGDLYPKVSTSEQGKMNVTAWIWTRTVTCPNPLCGVEVPLFNSLDLSKKKGHEHHIAIQYDGKKSIFTVKKGISKLEGTVKRSGAYCPHCNSPISFDYLRNAGVNKMMKPRLAAIVGEGKRGRVFINPDINQENIASVEKPEHTPHAALAHNPRNFNTPIYGLENFEDLFSSRQLLTLTTLCDLLPKLQIQIEEDSVAAGRQNDHISINDGGTGARAYSEAIITFLAFAIDKATDAWSSLVGWRTSVESTRNTFSLQALPMVWAYAEANPFSTSCGNWSDACIESIVKFVSSLRRSKRGIAIQNDAQSDCGLRNVLVSTDPPYYDNIVYGDLSDYFYMWMRHNLQRIYPDVFNTMATPKTEELVATPYRFGGDKKSAFNFFEKGMTTAFSQIYKYANDEYPTSIYYAYKQQDSEEGTSSGWETMLEAIIKSGFTIDGTWPLRTEKLGRTNSIGSNALASSIVLICRKRAQDASQTTRRNLINTLRRELRPALKKLQESNIAPVDLAQSAIGPGIGVFSQYMRVLEADGTPMTVKSALQVINEEIDLYFNEQVGTLDAMSRFCVELYTQNAFNEIKFGDADILARAKGTSVAAIASHDIVYAKAGTVHLIERTELSEKIDNNENCIWLLTQQLTQAMATGGVEACAKAIYMMYGSNAEKAKDLAYRLYTIAEHKKWTNEAFAYNALVVAWPDIQSRAAMMQRETPEQMDMFSMGLLET